MTGSRNAAACFYREKMKISNRLATVPSSPIRKLVPLAIAAKKNGIHVYHLNVGDPDIKTPAVMIDALQKFSINPIRYGHSQGEAEFLNALCAYYHQLGFPFIEPAHIQATLGGSEAIFMATFGVTDPGDEILTFEPLYPTYITYSVVNGIKLNAVPTKIETGFHLPSKNEIEKMITKKTKAIFICNPNNPTGTVYTLEEIEMLVELAKQYGLFLLSDEVYREYTYDGRKHISLLSYMQSIPDQAIVLDSLSKRYSACGLRLGALISLNAEIMAGALRMGQARLSAGFVDQYIGEKLTQVSPKYLSDVHHEFEERRNVLYNGLKAIPGITIAKPEGAFYFIIKLPVADSEHFCAWLLTDFHENNETVMLAPAAGFYTTKGMGKNEVRIAYVLNIEELKRSIVLLSNALLKYQSIRD